MKLLAGVQQRLRLKFLTEVSLESRLYFRLEMRTFDRLRTEVGYTTNADAEFAQPHVDVVDSREIPHGKSLQRGLYAFSVFAGLREDFVFAKGEEIVIAHYDVASDNDRFDVAGFQRVGELGVNVVHGDGIGLVEIDQDQIGFLAWLE